MKLSHMNTYWIGNWSGYTCFYSGSAKMKQFLPLHHRLPILMFCGRNIQNKKRSIPQKCWILHTGRLMVDVQDPLFLRRECWWETNIFLWKELFFILLIFSEFFNNVQWYSLGGCHLNISRKKQTCTRKDLVCIYMGQVSGWLLGFYVNAIVLLTICQLLSWDSLYVVCNLPNVCIQLTCFMMSNDFLRGCVGYDILIYSEEANIGREDSL